MGAIKWLQGKIELLFCNHGRVALALFLTMIGCTAQIFNEKPPSIDTASKPVVSAAEKWQSEGLSLYQKGDFGGAITALEHAEAIFERQNNPKERGAVLMLIVQSHQALGQFEQALQMAYEILSLAEDIEDLPLKIDALNLVGATYLGMGKADQAFQALDKSVEMSKRLGSAERTASILNNLGNAYTFHGEYNRAYESYMRCVALLEDGLDPELKGIALSNAATATLKNGQFERTRMLVDESVKIVKDWLDSHNKAYALIGAGLNYQALMEHLSTFTEELFIDALDAYTLAAKVAETIGDDLALSYAYGYWGHALEADAQSDSALMLTRAAIFKAQAANAPEALFRWQWQAGRLLKESGQIDKAVDAYQGAIFALRSLSQEKIECYGRSDSTFNEYVEAVSFELVDLLLKRSAKSRQLEEATADLLEAREVLELRKIYELRNYYDDDCVDAARFGVVQVDEISSTTVVLYPIVLEDRLEVLATLPDGIRRISTPVGRETLKEEVIRFRHMLEKRTTREYLPHARRLYDWFIRPIEEDLKSISVDTLVIVPDGPLRTIPMAALHDGNGFLVERYAVAVTPVLELTDPRPLLEKDPSALVMGLTEAAQGFPPLPYVSSELQKIQEMFRSKLLLNQHFLSSTVESALKDQQYSILHIASHAQFGEDVDSAFIVTYDGRLSIRGLDRYIGLLKFRDKPLELLTLSACETASGDENAALGLAGIAIKAGARSALASLWHVNDYATSVLIDEFYRELRHPNGSKAKALQSSQLKIMKDRRYRHPCYWSPFLILNNWL